MSLYPTTSARAVDVSRGGHSTLLNREWLERPDDERFLSLDALYDHVRARASASQEAVLPLGALTVNGGDETIRLETSDRSMAFSHWSFAQLCRLVGAPADYLRALPVELSQRDQRARVVKYKPRCAACALICVNRSTKLECCWVQQRSVSTR